MEIDGGNVDSSEEEDDSEDDDDDDSEEEEEEEEEDEGEDDDDSEISESDLLDNPVRVPPIPCHLAPYTRPIPTAHPYTPHPHNPTNPLH